MQSLAVLAESNTVEAKTAVMEITRDLMPGGQPQFKNIVHYTPLVRMIEAVGYTDMMKLVFLMVQDLCNSFNVVRNMNEDQMIEAAGMLLDECGDFRLEDYQIMFTLGKRGQLVRIMDRIDINIISAMMDAYYDMRRIAGQQIQEQQFRDKDNQYNDRRVPAPGTPEEQAMSDNFSKLAQTLTAWKAEDDKVQEEEKARKRKEQIEGYAKLHDINMDELLKQFGKHVPTKS